MTITAAKTKSPLISSSVSALTEVHRSAEILRHAPRGGFGSLLIRRKKIDADFTITDKESMHYEWYHGMYVLR